MIQMEGVKISALVVLSDYELISVYKKAVDQQLEEAFIQLLIEEINQRGLLVELVG